MANKIQLRRDSAANWSAFNPILADGEIGIDTTNGYMKFGDGVSPWNECMYVRFPGVGPDNLSITGTPPAATVGQGYSFVPTITGGTGPYVVTSIGAPMPAGLVLGSSTGSITGTPSTAANHPGISLRVTDSQGNVATLNLPTLVVSAGAANVAPANTALPAISGTAQVDSTLSSTVGSWTGTPTPTYARQWLRNGSPISGATGATYLLATADLGATITLRVVATNSVDSAEATSSPTAAVVAAPADSRARFGYGAAGEDPAAILSRSAVYGVTNGSKAGTFTIGAVPAGEYVWFFNEASASAAGVNVSDSLGSGGWQGASYTSGPNADDPNVSPNTSSVTASLNGVTFRAFRNNYPGGSGTITTI